MDSNPITYEQVLILFAETSRKLAETGEYINSLSEKTDKQLAETGLHINSLSEKTDKQLAETGLHINSLSEKTDKQLAETGLYIKALSEKTDKQLAETDKQLKILAKQVGDVTDTLGRFAEEQVRPRILELFRAKGIELEETYPRVSVKKNGKPFLEIDLLLVNTIYSVVVEVKNTLRQRDIDDHLDRLSKLQETPSRTIKGTTMYGAVAGMIVTDEVEAYAIKKGFYVIKPKGDSIEISNKENFKPKTWEVKNK